MPAGSLWLRSTLTLSKQCRDARHGRAGARHCAGGGLHHAAGVSAAPVRGDTAVAARCRALSQGSGSAGGRGAAAAALRRLSARDSIANPARRNVFMGSTLCVHVRCQRSPRMRRAPRAAGGRSLFAHPGRGGAGHFPRRRPCQTDRDRISRSAAHNASTPEPGNLGRHEPAAAIRSLVVRPGR